MSSSNVPTSYYERNQRKQFDLEAPLQEVIAGAEERIEKLLTTEDYLITKNVDDVQYLVQATRSGKDKPDDGHADKAEICKSMVKMKVQNLFFRIWEKQLDGNFCAKNDTSNDELYFIIVEMTRVMVFCTDRSTDHCVDIYESGLYKNLVKYLKLPQLSPAATSDLAEAGRQHKCTSIARHLLEILLNIIQFVPDSRDPIRDLDCVPLLLSLKNAYERMVSSNALIILAYLMTEAENNEHLRSDGKAFEYVITIVNGYWKGYNNNFNEYLEHRTAAMFSTLNRLAVNDCNKHRLVCAGALPQYVKALKSNSVAIQRLAAEGLWNLAFKCKEDIILEPGCVEALTQLSENSKDPEVKKQVDGVLWMLTGKDQASRAPEIANDHLGLPSSNGEHSHQAKLRHKSDQHIFISYQWDSKSTVLQLRDKLRASGFKVWVDVDSMSGSVLEAMAAAVENAVVVLICLTNKYKESPYCRTEAEYTFRLRKSIVPLRLQDRYYPDGWLGALIGSKLVHDFTKEFEIVFPDLVRDLDNRGRGAAENGVEGSISQGQGSNTKDQGSKGQGQESDTKVQKSNDQGQSLAVKIWTKSNISEWLKRNKLNHRKDWFAEFDGRYLQELRIMRRDSPELFHLLLRDNNFSMIDILKMNQALKEL